MFKQFKFKLFLKLFIFYLCSIILPFIITSLFLSQIVISTYKNNVFSLYNNITEHLSNTMDANLMDIESSAIALKKSTNILNASSYTNASDNNFIYNLKLLQDELVIHKSYQNTTDSMAIYFSASDVVITNMNKFTINEYSNYMFSGSSIPESELLAILNGNETKILMSNPGSSSQNYITVVKPLYEDFSGNRVTLISTVETRSVFNNFQNMTSDLSKAYFVIADESAPLIMSSKTPDVLKWQGFLNSNEYGKFINCSDGYVALKNSSALYGLNYVYIISESEILNKVNFIQTLLTIIMFIILIILAVVAYIFSCRSFSPVAALIKNSSESDSYYKLDSYDDISVLVTDTINTNNSLRGTIDRQRKCINDNLFVMFLQNSMDMNKQTLDMLFADVRPELNKPFYNVILVNILNYSEFPADVARLSTVETMRRILEENEVLFTLIPNDIGRIIVLANHNITNNSLQQLLKKLANDLKNNVKIEISLSVGRQFDNLSMFSKSYEDALYSSTLKKQSYSGAVTEKDIKNIFFTTDDKKNLINSVISCDGATVHAFFENLISKIFVENTLTYRILSYIRYSLSETLSEIIYKSVPNDELDKIQSECRLALEGQNYLESFKIITECFLKVTDTLAKIKNAPSEDLRNTLANYIAKNYSNPEISLNHIAKELHFSYSYLCKFFKKEMGCVFLDYLHSVRIENGKKMLEEGKKSIAEIGESLGYLSSNTFIKTFKKYEGMSPGEYRKNFNA